MNKKVLTGLGILLLVLTAMISFFAIVKPIPISRTVSESTAQNKTIKVAVVNEDTGTLFNGQQLNIGSILINSFTEKNNYPIEVVSRSIAENGLKNDTYQLMIILPSKFSEESLALESTSPIQANFQYQILSDKKLVVDQAEQAVVDFKELFNKDLVNIYFTSIIGNLQTAQVQVADVVTNEKESLSSFNDNLVDPLSRYSEQFTGIGASPTNLLSTYSSFNKDLLNTNDTFTSIIDVDKTYDSVIDKIKRNQEAWELSLDTREQNLQAYDQAFSKLSVEEQLTKLQALDTYIANNLKEPKIWNDTMDSVEAYNGDISELVANLTTLNTEIDNTLSNYDAKIKEAVAASLANNQTVVDGANQTLGGYIQSLNSSMDAQIGDKWPNFYYDDATIDSLSLSPADKQHLKNINAFMKWYHQKTGRALPNAKTTTFEKNALDNLRQDIKSKIETSRSISLPVFEGEIASVFLTVPDGYGLNVSGYSTTQNGNRYQVLLPTGTTSGTTIPYTLTVQDENNLHILSPVVVQMELNTTEDVMVIKKDAPYDETTETSESSSVSTDTAPTTASSPTSDDNPGTVTAPNPLTETKTVTIVRTITVTKTNQTETKVVKRQYKDAAVISNWNVNPEAISTGTYQDVQGYLQLSGLATGYYGLDLSDGVYSANAITPADDSLASLANSDDLKSIVTNLIKSTTVEALKSDLKFSDAELATIKSRLVNAKKLETNIGELKTKTNDLAGKASQLVKETENVQKTITEKPAFTETEKVDNTDMVTVSMDMNSDLAQLMAASQTLMDNTKANQAVSETIESSVKQLSDDVSALEKDGVALSERVAQLQGVMTDEYDSNEEFLKNFATVLSNTKTGNEKNNAVYEYLSNPVDASKVSNVVSVATSPQTPSTRQDERSGLLIILIGYLVSIAVAYLMQHANKEELQKRLNLTQRLSLKNATGPMIFLSGIAGVTGLIIAVISGMKLDFTMGQISLFTVLLILILLAMTYANNLLLDKLKSFGFLISIALLMLYIITATQLFDAYYTNPTQLLVKLSPLTYLEGIVRDFINSQGAMIPVMMLLAILAGGLGIGNVFLYREIKEKN